MCRQGQALWISTSSMDMAFLLFFSRHGVAWHDIGDRCNIINIETASGALNICMCVFKVALDFCIALRTLFI